ncbi:uncharacterized protein LOC110694420 [Chenopodium quinoa]|uniref:uncharacterized protein LOC110694420 n=1 Tax=Chenopodium quinoa TaxID=63459 RepID=UPI000B78735D|nr:uncharacterized protein LOC110694420 [Chenopodium quinoa]
MWFMLEEVTGKDEDQKKNIRGDIIWYHASGSYIGVFRGDKGNLFILKLVDRSYSSYRIPQGNERSTSTFTMFAAALGCCCQLLVAAVLLLIMLFWLLLILLLLDAAVIHYLLKFNIFSFTILLVYKQFFRCKLNLVYMLCLKICLWHENQHFWCKC